MKKFFTIFFMIIYSITINDNIFGKNLWFYSDCEQKEKYNKTDVYFLFLNSKHWNNSIFGAGLQFTSKPFNRFLFNALVEIGIDSSFERITYKSVGFNVICNIDIQSFISNNIDLTFYYNSHYSIFVEQSYNYKATSKLLYGLGYSYFYRHYGSDTIRLFVDANYNVAKLPFADVKRKLRIDVGSRLFYDFSNYINSSTIRLVSNSIRGEIENNIGNTSFGIQLYFEIGFCL